MARRNRDLSIVTPHYTGGGDKNLRSRGEKRRGTERKNGEWAIPSDDMKLGAVLTSPGVSARFKFLLYFVML